MSMHKNVITLCCAAAFALGLAACSSSDDPPPPPPPPPPVDTGPTAYEAGKAAIMAATTVADAEAAYDDIDLSMVSGDEAASLMMARDDRVAAIMAETAYARGMAAIMAAMTAADADAAYAAIDQNAITGAQADSLMMALNTRKMEIATADRIAMQKMDLMDAADAIDTSDLSTQALVDAARMAIADLRQALTDAVDVSEADKMMYMSTLNDAVDAVDMAQGGIDTDTRRTNQMTALSDASDDLQAALAALSGTTPTQAQLDAANDALGDLNDAITGGADLTDTEKAPFVREAANAMAPIRSAQMAFDDAEDEDDKADAAMMAATAAKLYAGIGAAPLTATGDGQRSAAYSGTDNADITLTIDDAAPGDGTDTTAILMEDDDTMVAANHGWEGKRYTRTMPAGEGVYEAYVYSDVEDPTMGKKFGSSAAVPNDDYEYQLSTDAATLGEVTAALIAANIASPSFDQSAGVKEFELPTNTVRVMLAGTYHGVSGTYNCTPAATSTCAVQVAAEGFTLGGTADADNAFTAGGGTWTFKPSSAEARVMESEDTEYVSYGWWLHKAANDGAFTASAFVDYRGGDGTAELSGDIITDLNGTATYMGGAAGKYALASSTGGTNDAGHFTARATLEADFTNNTSETAITGTIDMFIGADGQSRDWEVELSGSPITNGGAFGVDTDRTTWTIDGTAATAAGNWSGQLYNTGDDGVPRVAAGTFFSEYGTAGRMVGAFGANAQ